MNVIWLISGARAESSIFNMGFSLIFWVAYFKDLICNRKLSIFIFAMLGIRVRNLQTLQICSLLCQNEAWLWSSFNLFLCLKTILDLKFIVFWDNYEAALNLFFNKNLWLKIMSRFSCVLLLENLRPQIVFIPLAV